MKDLNLLQKIAFWFSSIITIIVQFLGIWIIMILVAIIAKHWYWIILAVIYEAIGTWKHVCFSKLGYKPNLAQYKK